MTKRVVDVLLPVALDRAYSYRVPEELELAPGDIVCVPLGAREATAVVWADNPKPNPRLDNRLKDVEQKLELPPLRPELRGFVDWVANYTVSSRGMVLRMCLRMGEHLGAERERVGVRLAGAPPQRMTPARQRVLALFADGMVRGKSDAAREAGVSTGVIDGLIDEGTLETVVLPPEPVAQTPDPDFVQSEFTPDQGAAATALKATVAKGGYFVTLLDGVTGSGKTEVYFEAVADRIRRGRQSLVLMPEIALTAQFLDRFAARFGVRPAEWHSELSPRKRARTWRAVADGEVSVVVGARSALFLPYADLGLIVVDEEHEQAYKQDDGAHYHARDMAVVRAHIAKIPIVLASSFYPVELGVITSLAHPGGNITGVTHLTPELMAKRVQVVKEAVPAAARIAVLRVPGRVQDLVIRDMEAAARQLGIQLHVIEVRRAEDLAGAFAAVVIGHDQAVMSTQAPLFFQQGAEIAQLALKHRLPSLSGEPDAAEAGALLFYGPSIFEGCQHAAKYVDRILKGAKPADLPVEQPTKFELIVNLKTARALGLTIPPSLLQRADHVIE